VTSCAKTAEPIEMQFGMLSRVGPGNKKWYYKGMSKPLREGALLGGLSGRLKSTVKHNYDFDGWVKE